MKKEYDPYAAYQPEFFTFKDQKKVEDIIARYPEGQAQSAVMPLLDLVQREMAEEGATAEPPYGGWIPQAAMDTIAHILSMPKIKVYEVATFYSMYNLVPVGKYLLQFCTTTPCWLRGAGEICRTCEEHLNIKMGETTKDKLFTMMEVECLGACVNAPVVQINDTYYEDLTPARIIEILDDLKAGKIPEGGSQTGRQCSKPCACGRK